MSDEEAEDNASEEEQEVKEIPRPGDEPRRLKVKLDHLGKVVKTGGRQRYRYARTYTVVYDGNGTEA